MALVTHQVQGSCITFPRLLSWSKGVKLKQHVTTTLMRGRVDRCSPLKQNLRLRVSAYKGTAQNDKSGKPNGYKGFKHSAKVSYVHMEGEDTMVDVSKAQTGPVSYGPDADETISGSPAIRRLFQKWLNSLRTQTSSQVVDGIIEDSAPPSEASQENQCTRHNEEKKGTLKAVWFYFLSLDATVKVPIVMFIPLYLAVNSIYGAEVSKELTPLWILGPLAVAFYIKMLKVVWALYVFSFKLTVKVIKNLPSYYRVTYSFIAQGKVKDLVRARVFQPVEDVKNLEYKRLSRIKMKEAQEWLTEKYLDYVESIWPYYCRTIRFLKKANLI